ncbi:MAG: hypothetical protein R3346_03655 [Candidatus Spechtbacterales bacterium]|nr:hypothetical protein [Candidatus Spechtbacterales bacterium]
MQVLIIFAISLIGWVTALGIFFVTRDVPRALFIAIHYIVNIVLFGFLFGVYYRFLGSLSPIITTVVAMISFLFFEFVLWVFIAPESASNYLNVVDWLIPAFLIVLTIYLTGIIINN